MGHRDTVALTSAPPIERLPGPAADLLRAVPLLRTASHVDALRILADALERRMTDPASPSLEALLGLNRPGPGHARRMKTALRDGRLQRIRRQHYGGMTVAGAATEMWSAATAYETGRYRRSDRHHHAEPADEPQASFWYALSIGRFPAIKTLQKILSDD